MNLNNLTIKAQEAVAQAQQLAFNGQNQQIETAHVLKAMLDNEDNSIEYSRLVPFSAVEKVFEDIPA